MNDSKEPNLTENSTQEDNSDTNLGEQSVNQETQDTQATPTSESYDTAESVESVNNLMTAEEKSVIKLQEYLDVIKESHNIEESEEIDDYSNLEVIYTMLENLEDSNLSDANKTLAKDILIKLQSVISTTSTIEKQDDGTSDNQDNDSSEKQDNTNQNQGGEETSEKASSEPLTTTHSSKVLLRVASELDTIIHKPDENLSSEQLTEKLESFNDEIFDAEVLDVINNLNETNIEFVEDLIKEINEFNNDDIVEGSESYENYVNSSYTSAHLLYSKIKEQAENNNSDKESFNNDVKSLIDEITKPVDTPEAINLESLKDSLNNANELFKKNNFSNDEIKNMLGASEKRGQSTIKFLLFILTMPISISRYYLMALEKSGVAGEGQLIDTKDPGYKVIAGLLGVKGYAPEFKTGTYNKKGEQIKKPIRLSSDLFSDLKIIGSNNKYIKKLKSLENEEDRKRYGSLNLLFNEDAVSEVRETINSNIGEEGLSELNKLEEEFKSITQEFNNISQEDDENISQEDTEKIAELNSKIVAIIDRINKIYSS